MDDLAFPLFGGLLVAVYLVVNAFVRLSIPEPLGLPYPFWLGLLGFTLVLFFVFGLG